MALTDAEKLAKVKETLNTWRVNKESEDGDRDLSDDHYALQAIDQIMHDDDWYAIRDGFIQV